MASLRPGLALVQGRLQGDPLLRSPFQQRDCVYYYFRVLDPTNERRPRTLAKGKEWTLAAVEDDSGRADLQGISSMVGSPRRFETELRDLSKIPPDLAGFFERAGIDEKHLARLTRLVVHEFTLEPGDVVYVTGAVREEAGTKTFYRPKRGPLIVSSQSDVGYVRGLRNELLIYLTTPPLLLLAGLALVLLALA